MVAIKLLNPKDRPFGALSNNFVFPISINGKKYKSVSNYIYSTALYGETSQIMAGILSNNLKEEYEKLKLKNYISILSQALDKSIQARMETNEKERTVLLSTGTSAIVYADNDPILGIGVDGQGLNLYGKYLMQTRHRLNVSNNKKIKLKTIQERENLIYEVYVAERNISKLPVSKYDEYIGKNIKEIIDSFGGLTQATKSLPKKEIVLDLYNTGKFDTILALAVEYPLQLAKLLKKRDIRKFRVSQENKVKELIFDYYANYTLEKKFPDLDRADYDKAKSQEFRELSPMMYSNLKDRVYSLFIKGALSESLSKKIDQAIVNIVIPTEQETLAAEMFDVDTKDENHIQGSSSVNSYMQPQGEPVIVYARDNPDAKKEYLVLSPYHFESVFKVGGIIVPTVFHYIVYSLMTTVLHMSSKEAYNYLLVNPKAPLQDDNSFVTPENLEKIYNKQEYFYMKKVMRQAALKGIKVKFADREMKNLLHITANNTIIWNDMKDSILGGRENFVGNVLMDIRNQVYSSMKKEDKILSDLSSTSLMNIIQSDKFMRQWILAKVDDMTKVIYDVLLYSFAKNSESPDLNIIKAADILDIIYQPCSDIYVLAERLENIKVPKFVEMSVAEKKYRVNDIDIVFDKDITSLIWNRIYVMIYYVFEHMENKSLTDFNTTISNIQLIFGQKYKCESILPDKKDNCIASAIINLIDRIADYDKKSGIDEIVITSDNVSLAASIISRRTLYINPDSEIPPEISGENVGDVDNTENENLYGDVGDGIEFVDENENSNENDMYGDNGMSPGDIKIINKLEAMAYQYYPDKQKIADTILLAVKVIKSRMNNAVRNRVNIFADIMM